MTHSLVRATRPPLVFDGAEIRICLLPEKPKLGHLSLRRKTAPTVSISKTRILVRQPCFSCPQEQRFL